MKSRRKFLRAAGALAGVSLYAQASRRPNIVLIVADDLGYGHLGCYGQTKIRTPHLDALAAQGIRFTDAYAACTVCAPSRCAMMTGVHTGRCTVRANSGGVSLQPEDVTFPQLLQKAGYRTGLFGKWGLGDAGTAGVPNKKGFDSFYGYLHQLHAQYYYTRFLWRNEKRTWLANLDGRRVEYAPDLIEHEAIQFIRDHREEPFFLYLPYTLPHAELVAPGQDLREYEGHFPETPYHPPERRKYADTPAPRATLAAMISYMDRSIGRILGHLREQGLEENTLVVFLSDNGPTTDTGADVPFFQGAGPLRGSKGSLYEGGIRVPAMVRWPGRAPAGTVSEAVWVGYDLFPTLLAIAGAASPGDIDGVDLTPAFEGKATPAPDRMIYWEHTTDKGLLQAARWKNWKAVRNGSGAEIELYDLATDIAESHNVAAANPAIVSRLRQYLESAHREPPEQVEPESSFSRTDFLTMPRPRTP